MWCWTGMDEVSSSSISKDEDRIRGIIVHDNKDEFTNFLEKSSVINSGDTVKLKFGKSELCPYKLLGWICKYRAVHCGTALVEGKTGTKMDLNLHINGGATPLHEAAASLSAGLVELFLRHGAQADVRCSAADSEKHGLLPLHIALERASSTRFLNQWILKPSVFKLIVILCLPQMKEALEANRLLVQDMKEVKEVIRHYAKEVKPIELAILLMVAQEKFKEPISVQYEDVHTSDNWTLFYRCIKIELNILHDRAFIEYDSIDDSSIKKEKMLQLREWKRMMIAILLLLDIFDRAGAAIGAYLQSKRPSVPKEQVAQELARMLEEVGFDLNFNVDINDIEDSFVIHALCCPIKLVLGHSGDHIVGEDQKSEESSGCGAQRQDVCMPSYTKPVSFSDRNPLCGVPNEHWKWIRMRFPHGSSVLSSTLHPFRASCTSKASFCSGFPKEMEVAAKETSTGMEHYVRNFPSSKRWFSFALVVKRGVRGI